MRMLERRNSAPARMPVNVARGMDKILMTVRSFGKKSSYESLSEVVPAPQMKDHGRMGMRNASKSKLDCLPDDIPAGYLAVYVGTERRRFVISTKYLSHQLFRALLKQSEEEFGFDHDGGLEFACEPMFFEHLLWLIGTNSPAASTTQLHELLSVCSF